MACEVCQHCQEALSPAEDYAIQDGFSYHNKCHKCYVCSETNLINAELFKGVIFCSSCSKRIFQGCATARRTKSGGRGKSRTRSKRRERDRYIEQTRGRPTNKVLELARLTASTDIDSKSNSQHETHNEPLKLSNTPAITTDFALQVDNHLHEHVQNWTSFKKHSTEIGLTTDVTQELLKQMKCPIVEEFKYTVKPPPNKTEIKYKAHKPNKKDCSDLRIAELGASTEIAHMTLRKQSEIPVLIKSESPSQHTKCLKLPEFNQKSDMSGDVSTDWPQSTYSVQSAISNKIHCLDRRIASILKIPYRSFKRNILNRSSLITILMSHRDEEHVLVHHLKMLFNEEVAEHQRRGLRRLYSTINRRKTPFKLGWLNLMAKAAITGPSHCVHAKRDGRMDGHRCHHFRKSHSYRCMRSQVMRLAGPTKSELAVFRMRIKKLLKPKFLKCYY
ncbi:uncharacterized protein LOC131850244 isoform X2 [Achroia grisella]|uniref:uncharacterized protein LOC131850244 isoform X2 n=1 Tax=Achroia grisella TaxID=688607 RepID=UPI0027D22DA4|nr:uncharacterized protein LOC131850244 isoform X2 [Achroia grisella]